MKKEKKFLLISAFFLVITLAFGGMALAKAKMQFVAIATGGTGGIYYPLAGALAQVLSNKIPNLSVTAQSGNASVANCNLVARKEVETAFAQNNVTDSAFYGLGPWKGKPLKNLRVIASLYPETIQIVALAGSGINIVPDCKGKRIAIGDKGSGTEFDARNILNFHGITYDMIKPDYVGFSAAAQRLKDDQADMLFWTAGYPTSGIIDLTTVKKVKFVSLTDEGIRKLCEKYKFYVPITMPPNTYRGQDYPVKGIAMMALWIIHEDVPEKLVYDMTRVLWEKTPLLYRKKKEKESGAGIMAKVHQQGKNMTLETALDGVTVPLHPGAEKYYRERGMIK